MRKFWLGTIAILVIALTLTGCGANSTTPQQNVKPGTVYLIGTDAPPMASVVAFQISLDSLTLSDGTTSQAVVPEKTAIEFSRLLGLRTLLGINQIPPGSYTSATVKLSQPVISYLDLTTTPASVSTIDGTLTQDTFTINFPQPVVIGESGLAGVHLHLLLNRSLEVVDGQLTGKVTPVIRLRPLWPADEDSQIDELRGGLSSVNMGDNSFVIQGLHGRQLTVVTDNNTIWQTGESLSTLSVPAIIQVSGKVRADGAILANEVEVIARDRFFVGGLVLDATPATGPADSVTLLVREEFPDFEGINVGKTGTVAFDSTTRFDIFALRLPVDFLLFNRSSLVRGQRVALGGTFDTTTSPPTLHPRRVVLHVQGLQGDLVAGSVVVNHGNEGSFKLATNGLFGYLFAGEPMTVTTSTMTRFVGVAGLAELSNTTSANLRVVGLLLRTANGPILAAYRVEKTTD